MYRVINATSKNLRYGKREILPNEEVVVISKVKDMATFESGTAKCEIISLCGEHASICEGNIICLPYEGVEGTTFSIKEKE